MAKRFSNVEVAAIAIIVLSVAVLIFVGFSIWAEPEPSFKVGRDFHYHRFAFVVAPGGMKGPQQIELQTKLTRVRKRGFGRPLRLVEVQYSAAHPEYLRPLRPCFAPTPRQQARRTSQRSIGKDSRKHDGRACWLRRHWRWMS